MKRPWVYMSSPSRSPLPPPSPPAPSRSSQSTRSLSHASNLGWWSVSLLIVYMFRCCSLETFLWQRSLTTATYVQNHYIPYVHNSAEPYVKYKSIWKKAYPYGTYQPSRMKTDENNTKQHYNNHKPGTMLSPLYIDFFMYFKGFKAYMYFTLYILLSQNRL